MNDAGQSALADAMLFFLVMAVASGLLLGYSALAFNSGTVLDREAGLRYASNARAAILRATLTNVTYESGGKIALGTVTVERWLLEQVALRRLRVPASAFDEGNARVRELARSAIRPDFGFGLLTRTDSVAFSIMSAQDAEIPSVHYDSSWTYSLPNDLTRTATIVLFVWLGHAGPSQ